MKIWKNNSTIFNKRYIANKAANISTMTFGDFKLAFNNKKYKEQKNKKSEFHNILYYARTLQPAYKYYIQVVPKEKHYDTLKHCVKDTQIGSKRFVLLISNNAPKLDVQFISNNL